jgi:hypothetical protein
MEFLDLMVEQQFLKPVHRETVLAAEKPEELIQQLLHYDVPQVDKWIGRKT